MTEQEKQAIETLTRSFTKMETLYKVKCTEVETKEEEISKLKAENDALRERLNRTVKDVAERIKMEFYYEFDELIPSIMADKIDEIVKEVLND